MATYPLSLSVNKRYLIDAAGVPFRIQGEGIWMQPIKISLANLSTFFQDRVAKGFNSCEFSIIERGAGNPNTIDGYAPFSTPGDFTTINNTYFNYMERVIDLAASYGLVVQLFYAYMGYEGGSQGWWSAIGSNTQTACYNYGLYLGGKYASKSNIIWMAMGDYSPPNDAQNTKAKAILQGIRDAGATQICGAESGPPDSIPANIAGYTAGPTLSSNLQLHSYYTCGATFDGFTYTTADAAWNHGTTLPAYGVETYYENAAFIGTLDGTPTGLRKYHFWSVLAGGIAGCNYGNQNIYDFPTNWASYLNSLGAVQRGYAHTFFATLPWWKMLPSGVASGYYGRTIVVSGQGSGSSYIASQGDSDGKYIIVYVPPTGIGTTTFSIDPRSLIANYRARWWNPVDGTYTDINSGAYSFDRSLTSQSFTSPGMNAALTNDWMLVLNTPLTDVSGNILPKFYAMMNYL